MAPTLTEDVTYVSFPIEKWETDADGDLIVYGKATDGSLDSDDQIVDPFWAREAVPQWHKTGGNVRFAHDAHRPVGTSLGVDLTDDGVYVRTLVVDPTAKRLVEKGVLRAYSVGISRPVVERDITGKARGGIIKGGELAEISLVDRPANRNCTFTLAKADSTGTLVKVSKLEGAEEFLAKASAPSPLDVARRISQSRYPSAHSYSDPIAQRLADALAAEVMPEYAAKRDFSEAQRDDAASGGEAMDDGSFPIYSKSDLANAIHLAGHAKDPAAARAHIRRRAAALDASGMIPETWKVVEFADLLKAMTREEANRIVGFDLIKETPAPEPAVAEKAGKPSSQDAADTEEANDSDDDDPAQTSDKAGKKKMPFGGNQAMPFGKKPKKGAAKPADGDGSSDKAAALRAQIAQLQAELEKCTPTMGVSGPPQAEPVPAHRGGGSMTTGPDVIHPDQLWGKAMQRVTDAPYAAQRAHDALCPAYPADLVKTAYPALGNLGLAADPQELRESALATIAAGDLDSGDRLLAAAKAATYLSALDAVEIDDAMAGLRKAFTDMYPSVRLSPGQVMPSQFQRGFLTPGHARTPSPSGDTSPGTVPAYHPAAADFRRGPITAGQERPSPGNKGDSNPFPAGTPAGTILAHAQAAQVAAAACRTIHDYHAARWNGVCPLAGAEAPAVKGKKGKGKKAPAPEMGPMDPVPAMPATPSDMKSQSPITQSFAPPSDPVVAGGDITIMLANVERQLRKLRRTRDEQQQVITELTKNYESRTASQDTEIAELRRSVDILGSQADMSAAPNRSAVAKSAASGIQPAERRSLVDEAGEQYRTGYLKFLQSLEASGDPGMREGAARQIRKVLSP
jgi:hypothetical protein